MSTAAAAPKLHLCDNLTIDFSQLARSHHIVGVIWRVAAIVCVVAASAIASYLWVIQASEFVLSLDIVLLYGSLSALTLLVFRSMWIAGSDEFAQSQFYQRVADKEIELNKYWQEDKIKAFFSANSIQLPRHAEVVKLLQEKAGDNKPYLRAFIPTIAHYKTLRAEATCPNSFFEKIPIKMMQRAVDQLNLAMVLQSMHRPTENRGLKIDNRFIDTIPGVGKLDKMEVIRQLNEEKDCPAFVFEGEEPKAPLSVSQLDQMTPKEIRAEIFDTPKSNELE